jgi:4-hydroxy-tetrahydrodipicolinate synthase
MVLKLEGIIPAMVTLFKDNYELDEEANRNQINFLIENGVHAILIAGSTGEFMHLSKEERKKLAEICVDEANNRVPIIIGTGSTSTDEVIELTKHAKDIGADAVQIQAPYYFKFLSNEMIYQHFKTIAESVDIPITLYNFPSAIGINLDPLLIANLAQISNIIALKDTTSDLSHMQKVLQLTKNKNFHVIAGSDDMLLPLLIIGGHGSVTGLGNFLPSLPVKLYNAFKNGNLNEARKLHEKIILIREIMLSITNPPIAAIKVAMKLIGRPVTYVVRRPLLSLSDKQREELIRKFREINILP